MDSRLLRNAMGHPSWPKPAHYNTLSWNAFFRLFFTQNISLNSVENYRIGTDFKRAPKRNYEKVFQTYHTNARFLSLCLAYRECIFSHFYSKKNDRKK